MACAWGRFEGAHGAGFGPRRGVDVRPPTSHPVLQELDAATSRAVVGGDAKCLSIAAASVVAKVTRDRLVVALDAKYPQYGFAQHKGYGTAAHVAALRQHGPCPVHRRTFAPVKDMV